MRSVAWCPNPALSLVAVAADRKCLLINPGVGDSLVMEKTDAVLSEPPPLDNQGRQCDQGQGTNGERFLNK